MLKNLLLVGIIVTGSVSAQSTITLGDKVDHSLLTPLKEVLEQPQKYVKQSITVVGKVTTVCQKRGCWADITADNGKELRLKVRDGDIVIPMSARGRTAYATGMLVALSLSKDQATLYLEHMAQDAGQDFDRSTVTSGMTIYQLRPTAIEIVGDQPSNSGSLSL
ncbi:MAG: DUF4920 domain-containing protein [Gammaproteobacteria bacterium]|nr:DUF4920 domain-containing protein [Gammaproteobacteria bacterium]